MEKYRGSLNQSFTDIRFNIFYSVCTIIIAIILVAIFFTQKENDWYYEFFLILALLFLIQGIYGLTISRYVRLDKENKLVKIYTLYGFAARTYKYERLFFKDNELYREYDGKQKMINILRFQCRKKDYETFVEEVNKGV
jgi:hypothetical protein